MYSSSQKKKKKKLTKCWAFQKGYCEENGCHFADTENTAVPTSSLTCTVWSPHLMKDAVQLQKKKKKNRHREDNQKDPGDGAAAFSKRRLRSRDFSVQRGDV